MSALTDVAIRKAKPRDKPYKLTDGRGLYLLINKNGSKWWRFNFTLPGKPRRTMSLGVYPDVELGDARTERDRVRKLVQSGVDPVAERRAPTDAEATFKAIALQWMAANRSEWSDRTYGVRKRRLERHIFPEIGSRDVRTIEPTDMLRLIRKIEETGVAELPWRMRADCGAIFQFAISSGWQMRDPTPDIRKAMKKQAPVAHRAFIRPAEMGAFLVALHDREHLIEDVTRDAMMLTILTAGRTVEIRFAERSEFEGLGGERPQWRIPAVRMKMRREHIVPLSRQAAAIVERRLAAGGDLLFSRGTRSGAISSNTLIYALYRLGYHSRATVHGFRRTFSTWGNEATMIVDGQEMPRFNPDWIEWCLAHVPSNAVRAVYNAAEYLPQRRRLLDAWADWLEQQRQVSMLIG